MTFGVLTSAQQTKMDHLNSYGNAAGQQKKRKAEAFKTDMAIKDGYKQSGMAGAGLGTSVGMMTGGPAGAVVGGVAGFFGGYLLDYFL